MAIAREEIVVDGHVLYKTRPYGMGGLNTAWKLERVKVLDVNRRAARIRFDNGKEILAPFQMLQADEEFLSEHERREAAKKERIRKELEASEGAIGQPPTLTFTLAEKLHAEEPDDDAPVAQSERDKALDMLAQLKAEAAKPHPWKAQLSVVESGIINAVSEADDLGQRMASVYPKQDREQDELALARQRRREAREFPGMKPEEEVAEEREEEVEVEKPELQTQPIAPLSHLPPPAPPALSPIERMLQKVQAELETLIAEEADVELRLAEAQKLVTELSARLEANRGRQKVLSAQERTALSVQRQTASKPAAAQSPAVEPEAPKEALPVAEATEPAPPVKRRPGRPPGAKNKPRPTETLRTVYAAAEVAGGDSRQGTLGPGWLRRRSPTGPEAAE